MTKRLRAFTLIECIVAMAILAIASMLLVQAYSALARVSSNTSETNNSIYQQMKNAENPTEAEGAGTGVSVKKITTDSTKKTFTINATINGESKSYTTKVDVYVINPYGIDDVQLSADSADSNPEKYNRYIYFHS